MSIDMAVWEGPAPESDDGAAATFNELYERYIESGDLQPPTPAIRAFVDALLSRYPDLTEVDVRSTIGTVGQAVALCRPLWSAAPDAATGNGPRR